jgi:hypothetical protein
MSEQTHKNTSIYAKFKKMPELLIIQNVGPVLETRRCFRYFSVNYIKTEMCERHYNTSIKLRFQKGQNFTIIWNESADVPAIPSIFRKQVNCQCRQRWAQVRRR